MSLSWIKYRKRWKGSEITTALSQGATNQESSILTLWLGSNDGADLGTLTEHFSKAWPMVWVPSSAKKGNHEASRLKGAFERNPRSLAYLFLCPRSMPPHPHFIHEIGEAQGEETGVSEPSSGHVAVLISSGGFLLSTWNLFLYASERTNAMSSVSCRRQTGLFWTFYIL